MAVGKVSDASFESEVLKATGPSWWISGRNGAARAG